MAIARPRREAGRRPNRACAVCVLQHQLAEFNPVGCVVLRKGFKSAVLVYYAQY